MPTCEKCGRVFPVQLVIEGKARILNRRRYCLSCSPFGTHNTRQLHRERTTTTWGRIRQVAWHDIHSHPIGG